MISKTFLHKYLSLKSCSLSEPQRGNIGHHAQILLTCTFKMKPDLLLGESRAHPYKPECLRLNNYKTISNKWTIKQVSLFKGPNDQLDIGTQFTQLTSFSQGKYFPPLHPQFCKEIQQQAPSRQGS